MESHEQMGAVIRRLRSKLGLTQEELAHALGITVGTVNRWENGRFRPSKLARSTIADFARKHGIALDEENGSEHSRKDGSGHLPSVN
jgi:DNA-binding transcriptional regulator YiaG